MNIQDEVKIRKLVEAMSYKFIDSGSKEMELYAKTMLIFLAGENPFPNLSTGKSGRKALSIFELWNCYTTVCEQGSINKAAQELGVSRTEINKRLGRLEGVLMTYGCDGLPDEKNAETSSEIYREYFAKSVMGWVVQQDEMKRNLALDISKLGCDKIKG